MKDIPGWLASGASQKQIANRLGISLSSLKNYKAEHEELYDALSFGKGNITMDIAKTVVELAQGYTYEVKEPIKLKNEDGSERVEVKTVTKYVPPSMEAIKYFLKNRTKKWSDNPQALELKKQELDIKRREEGFTPSSSKVEVIDDV